MTMAFDWYVDETQFVQGTRMPPANLHVVRSAPEASDAPVQRVTPDAFRAAFRKHPAGVAVVTTCAEGRPLGLVVSSVISLSAEPAMLAFSVSNSSASGSAMLAADSLVVHLMGADHVEIAQRFATSGIDKFAGIRWTYLPTGEPVLHDAAVRLRGRVTERVTAGGSTLVVVSIVDVELLSPAEAGTPGLVYANRGWFSVDPAGAIESSRGPRA